MKKVLEKTKNLAYGAAIVAYEESNFNDLINPDQNAADTSVKQLIVNIINYSLFFLGVVAIVFIVYGGIMFVTSGGDSEKTTKAKNTLLYAVLGIIVIVLAFAIINWSTNIAGEVNTPSTP